MNKSHHESFLYDFKIQPLIGFRGLADATGLVGDDLAGLDRYLTSHVEMFVKLSRERLVLDYQASLDRGCHYRLHPLIFTWDEHLYMYADSYYPPYMERGNSCERPVDYKYSVGDVVVTQSDEPSESGLAIVLGCIDQVDGTMKLDLCGNTPMDYCRHATREDIASADGDHADQIRRYLGIDRNIKLGTSTLQGE